MSPAVDDASQSNAERSLPICYLFESEVLVWLLLKSFNHPHARDEQYRNDLLEVATDVLKAACSQGEQNVYIEGMPARDMNLIAALWYAESMAIQDTSADEAMVLAQRQQWLISVKKAMPSCFCDSDKLGPL